MSRPIDVEISVKSAAAVGAMAGIASSVASAGLAFVQAGISSAIDAIGNSIELASDKAEAASKVNVLFGESADQIHAAAERAATTVGLSAGQYEIAAGNLGQLLTQFDLGTGAAADMSQGMIQLAADVGSFSNADPAEVVEAMGAALRGESEPLRRFGILIDEAAIKSKGLELGVDASKTAVDQAGRAQAIYALMLEQSSAASGDFERTSSGLANSQRINAARMEDAWAKVGAKLLPLVNAILPMLADALVWIVDGIGAVIDAVADWVHDNQALVDSIVNLGRQIWDILVKAFGVVIDVIGELGYRFGGLIGLFIDLAGAIIDLGSAIIHVFQGDFEGAAEAGERMIGRLQGFQSNVQRVMGDASRKAADESIILADQTAEAQRQIWEDGSIDAMNAMAGIETAAGETGEAAGTALTDRTGAAILDGSSYVERAADLMAGTMPDALGDAQDDAVVIAQQTPGAIADGLRSRRDAWQSAWDQLKTDVQSSMDRTKEIAFLEAKLTGRRITEGLASTDPIVRAQAQETVRLIEQRLADLEGVGTSAGQAVGSGLSIALHAAYDKVGNAANGLARIIESKLELNSPAKSGPWSQRGGPIEWMRRNGERMAGALDAGLTSVQVSPPALALSGASSGSRGAVTVNVYAGVGDPVAIGREVSQALAAYQRASGTEA